MSSIRQMDHLPALTAARLAWSEPGANPNHHHLMKEQIRRDWPLLARALDRAQKENERR